MMRLPASRVSPTHFSGSPMAATSSSIGFTYAGAPPCSGPESAPTADDSAAPQSAPVEAVTRAVKVDAFRPCSAVQIQYVSIAFTYRGSASPRHWRRNLSAAVAAPRNDVVGDRIARAVGESSRPCDDPHHLRGEAAEVFSRLLVRDLVELAEPPVSGEARGLGLQIGRRVAGETGRLVRLRLRHDRVEVVVDEQTPHAARTGSGRRAPRCRRRGTGARRLRDRAPRSPSRRRPHLRARA